MTYRLLTIIYTTSSMFGCDWCLRKSLPVLYKIRFDPESIYSYHIICDDCVDINNCIYECHIPIIWGDCYYNYREILTDIKNAMSYVIPNYLLDNVKKTTIRDHICLQKL